MPHGYLRVCVKPLSGPHETSDTGRMFRGSCPFEGGAIAPFSGATRNVPMCCICSKVAPLRSSKLIQRPRTHVWRSLQKQRAPNRLVAQNVTTVTRFLRGRERTPIVAALPQEADSRMPHFPSVGKKIKPCQHPAFYRMSPFGDSPKL